MWSEASRAVAGAGSFRFFWCQKPAEQDPSEDSQKYPDPWKDCLICHSTPAEVARGGSQMFTLGCNHRLCGHCLPNVQKDECPHRCEGVQLPPRVKVPPRVKDVPAFKVEHSGKPSMVVIAHGRGSHALVDMPKGMQVVTYAENHEPLWSSEIVQITNFMDSFGKAPKTVIRSGGQGELEGLPAFRQVPNYSLSFRDHNDLESCIGRNLGIYIAKPGKGCLQPVTMPVEFGEGATTEAIVKYAAKLGLAEVVLLCCKSGDSNICIAGSHCGLNPNCEDAFMHLVVGQSYHNLKCEPMICARCRQPFEPMRITFTKCTFQFHGRMRPSGVEFALPPKTSLKDTVSAIHPITVDLKRDFPKSGAMNTWLTSWPI